MTVSGGADFHTIATSITTAYNIAKGVPGASHKQLQYPHRTIAEARNVGPWKESNASAYHLLELPAQSHSSIRDLDTTIWQWLARKDSR